MTPSNYAELVHGLTGLSERIIDHVAAIESAGCHAVVGAPDRFLMNLGLDLEKALRRVVGLAESRPGEPPDGAP